MKITDEEYYKALATIKAYKEQNRKPRGKRVKAAAGIVKTMESRGENWSQTYELKIDGKTIVGIIYRDNFTKMYSYMVYDESDWNNTTKDYNEYQKLSEAKEWLFTNMQTFSPNI